MSIRNYYVYSFLKSLVLIYPVYMILFESKGLDLSQSSLLLMIWSVPVALLEIPTGILADNWSRKNMLIIGNLLHAISYVLWFFSEGFFLFALGFIFWGISEAFSSGSIEALLFDSLKQREQENLFDKVYGRGRFYSSIGIAISMLTGGFFAMVFSLRFVLVVSVLSMLLCTFLAARFTEVNYFKQKKMANSSAEAKQVFATFKDAARFLSGNKLILIVVVLFIVVVGTAGMLDEYDQMIAKGYGLNLGLIGAWGALRYIVESLGHRTAYRIKAFFARIGVKDIFFAVWILCITGGILAGITGWSAHIMFMPFYGMFYFFMAAAGILVEDYVQQKIEEQGRSTVHSIVSLFMNLYGILFFGLFAIILTRMDVFGILLTVSIYILLSCIALALFYRFAKGGVKGTGV